MGIFHFGLDQKILGDLKSRGWGSGIWNPQKSRVKNPPKIPNPGNGELGFLRLENPQNFIPGIFWGWGFFFRGMGYPTKKPQPDLVYRIEILDTMQVKLLVIRLIISLLGKIRSLKIQMFMKISVSMSKM